MGDARYSLSLADITPEDARRMRPQELLQQDRAYFSRFPCLAGPDLRYVEETLVRLRQYQPTLQVLEWGAGGSTIYFTQQLDGWFEAWSWLAVEHDREWAEHVLRYAPRTTVKLCDTHGADPRKHRQLDMDEYVKHPATLRKQFDLVIIDGRCRRRCLLEVPQFLKQRGVCLLHDAQRPYYQCAMHLLRGRLIPGTLWWQGTW